MKKNVCIILCLVLTFSVMCGTASAAKDREFTLRSGIQFGDTVDEVKKKETSLEVDGEREIQNKGYGVFYKGVIAGYDGEAGFYFGDEGLNNAYYKFNTTNNPWSFTDSADPDDIYKTIYDSCSRQYGDALKEDEEFPVVGQAVESALYYIQNANAKALKYDQWVVLEDNGVDGVKIDLVVYYMNEDFHGQTYRRTTVMISYLPFLQKDIDNYTKAVDDSF